MMVLNMENKDNKKRDNNLTNEQKLKNLSKLILSAERNLVVNTYNKKLIKKSDGLEK